MKRIAALILAAGSSSRFGQSKQLFEIDGESLLRRIVRVARSAGCSPIVVVVGCDREKILPEVWPGHVVINENWNRGLGTSIRAGVDIVRREMFRAEALFLLTCDQLFVDVPVLRRLAALRENTAKAICASSYADTLGVPALFDRACFYELLELPDEAGAKSVILRDPDRVAEFHFPEAAIDIDTTKDFEQLRRLPGPRPRHIAEWAVRLRYRQERIFHRS